MQKQPPKQNKQQKRTGEGLAPMLALMTLAFVLLKATGVVSWSWAWVLSPLWVPIAVLIAVLSLEVISNFSNIVLEIIERR